MVVPIALPAALLATYLVVGPDGFGAAMILLATLKVIVLPLTFELFRMTGIDARGQAMALNWKVLFLIGLVASVFNNLLRFWLACCGALSSQELLLSYTGSIIGDMVGVAVVMLGAMAFFRALRG
jgi:phosphoglycerol transferase MdoB-like AlkP superfamily enzyme